MTPFQPLINLLVLMSALSIAAERLANAIKLGNPELREPRLGAREEKERERQISHRVLLVSVLLAVAIKADLFQILAHLEAPWDTLGWVPVGSATSATTSGRSVPELLYTLAGTLLTGISMGFGSKFWHDALDIVHGTRGRIERLSGAQGAGRTRARSSNLTLDP